MKRYRIVGAPDGGWEENEHPKGQYVRYEDVAWVSTAERLPGVHELVIANTKEYGPLLADRSTRNPDHGWSCEGKVTHWMPLPASPSCENCEGPQ